MSIRIGLIGGGIAICLLCLGGCTDLALDAVNALVPSKNYARTVNIAYGTETRQQLDIYLPSTSAAGSQPVALFFYGGSWKFGQRSQYKFLGEALAARGVVTVIADYRLYPEVKFPVFVADGASALSWVVGHIGEYGGDPKSIYLMGHSAGANIAALVALDPSYAPHADVRAKGLIGLAGPYAFHPLDTESVRDVFLGTGDLERARPITFAAAVKPPPPVFLAYGSDDTTVMPDNTLQLAEALRSAGGTVQTKQYTGIGHVGLMGAFARPFRGRAPVIADVISFIQETQKQ